MPKTAACKVAWVGVTSFAVLVLAALAGCSGEAANAARPQANDDHATTAMGREVRIEMVANDSGEALEIDKLQRGKAQGDIICDAEIESGKIRSCAYTPTEGFSGKDEFSYVVKDANGKTDSAKVYVRVKPAS